MSVNGKLYLWLLPGRICPWVLTVRKSIFTARQIVAEGNRKAHLRPLRAQMEREVRERIHSCVPGKAKQYQDFTPHHHPILGLCCGTWIAKCHRWLPWMSAFEDMIVWETHMGENIQRIEHAINLLLSIALGFVCLFQIMGNWLCNRD